MTIVVIELLILAGCLRGRCLQELKATVTHTTIIIVQIIVYSIPIHNYHCEHNCEQTGMITTIITIINTITTIISTITTIITIIIVIIVVHNYHTNPYHNYLLHITIIIVLL